MKIVRTYTDLMKLPTFEERFRYLMLKGHVGFDTFGFDRYLYEEFIRSKEWQEARDYVILRDEACDLAIPGREIKTVGRRNKIIIHHINPVELCDLVNHSDVLFDPEYLITTVKNTHDAIHYGSEETLIKDYIERTPNDTCPWRR